MIKHTLLGEQPSSGSLELPGGLRKHQGPSDGRPSPQRLARELRQCPRPVVPQPSRLPLPRTLGGAHSGPPAPPAMGALRIRLPAPSPPHEDPRGQSPLVGRCPRRPR